MEEKKSSIQTKIVTTLVFVILFIIALVFFIIIPTLTDIKTINDDIYFQREDLERKYLEGQLRQTIAENYERVKRHETDLQSIFVHPGQELTYITTIEILAEENNLELTLSLSDFDNVEQKTSSIPFTIQITGVYRAILSFINDLESQEAYFDIDRLVLTRKTRNTAIAVDQVTATLEGSLYTFTQ